MFFFILIYHTYKYIHKMNPVTNRPENKESINAQNNILLLGLDNGHAKRDIVSVYAFLLY